MKNNKGTNHILLSICLIVIVLIAIIAFNTLVKQNNNMKVEDITTDMLLLQGKIKVIAQENIIKKDERPLIGKKVSENLENEKVKTLINNGILNQDEEDFENYYIIDGEDLNQMELKDNLNGEIYIVNYVTYEIIISNGVNIHEEIHYRLTDILEHKDDFLIDNKQEKEEKQEEITNEITNTEVDI